MSNGLEKLTNKIQYKFTDNDLLTLALTHRSMGPKNNERLEFLGDALLNVIIADALFQRYQSAKEGELSRLRSSLVSGEALANLSKDFDLGYYIVLGPGELKSGGHKRASILACTVEAIIGAIYLDSDFEVCKQAVLAWYESRLSKMSLDNEYKDTKTSLQEYLQARKVPLPEYKLLKTEGRSHEQVFTVACEVASLDLSVTAKSGTRRAAEKEAANLMLEKLNHGK